MAAEIERGFPGEGASNDSGVVDNGNFQRFRWLFQAKSRSTILIGARHKGHPLPRAVTEFSHTVRLPSCTNYNAQRTDRKNWNEYNELIVLRLAALHTVQQFAVYHDSH